MVCSYPSSLALSAQLQQIGSAEFEPQHQALKFDSNIRGQSNTSNLFVVETRLQISASINFREETINRKAKLLFEHNLQMNLSTY